MTNGEKLKEIFPSIELYEKSHDAIQINFGSVWWNAEYKGGKATASNKAVANLADDIEGLRWYRVSNGKLTEGANSKTDTPVYKASDIERILEKYRG